MGLSQVAMPILGRLKEEGDVSGREEWEAGLRVVEVDMEVCEVAERNCKCDFLSVVVESMSWGVVWEEGGRLKGSLESRRW